MRHNSPHQNATLTSMGWKKSLHSLGATVHTSTLYGTPLPSAGSSAYTPSGYCSAASRTRPDTEPPSYGESAAGMVMAGEGAAAADWGVAQGPASGHRVTGVVRLRATTSTVYPEMPVGSGEAGKWMRRTL